MAATCIPHGTLKLLSAVGTPLTSSMVVDLLHHDIVKSDKAAKAATAAGRKAKAKARKSAKEYAKAVSKAYDKELQHIRYILTYEGGDTRAREVAADILSSSSPATASSATPMISRRQAAGMVASGKAPSLLSVKLALRQQKAAAAKG